jgi:hypothetical protein
VSENSATTNGGGIYNVNNVILENSTLSGNSASSGGGIYNNDSTLLTIENSTLSGNSADWAGGIANMAGTIDLHNTIIANSSSGSDCITEGGSISSDHSLIEGNGNACGVTNGSGGSLIGIDPLLQSLGDYGGSTQTFAPLPNSPAIDAGNNSTCLPIDQRGIIRPQGAACDIGAVESRGFTLTKAGDNQSAIINTAFTQPLSVTLSEAGGVGLSGMLITFTAPSSGASIALPTLVITSTDASGRVVLPVTANGLGGSYAVTASASDVGAVSFTLTNTYVITPTAGAHGSIAPATPQAVNHGSNITFTVTPDTGYHVGDVRVDGASQGPIGSYTFNNVTANHTITAAFAINTYTITPTTGSNGSIAPSAPQTVNYGGSITFTIAANTGYHISDVRVDGVPQGQIGTYTFNGVSANHTLTAAFAINTYVITPTAGANGSIAPSTPQTVNYGSSITFTIAANTGYHTTDVRVDGVSRGVLSTYTFTNVVANHTITAAFAINTYVITPTTGANGSITPSTPQTVNYGDSITFTIAPNTGYHTTDVRIDGVSQGALSTYRFSNIGANHTITAAFAINTYVITPAAGLNGSITPSTPQTVNYGGSITFTIAADANYHITDVGVDGASQGVISKYTFNGVMANHTITAAFAIDTRVITPTAGANGSITPGTPQTVNYGDSITFTITADTGYHIGDVRVDGVSQGTIGTYTFNNVIANHTITAAFAINTYIITPTAGSNGSITPSTPQMVIYGDSITFTIVPTAGYAIAEVRVDGVSQGSIGSYTFSAVAANHSITAAFANNLFIITPIAGTGGRLSPSNPQAVTVGDSITFTIAANIGFAIDDVAVDGASQGAISSYTFSNVSANHIITAAFFSTGPQTQTVGLISVKADYFTDLGNGQTQANGNVRLGHYLFLTGPDDSVIYDATTLTATGKLTVIANGSSLDVLTGTFRAPVATGVAVPIGSAADLITSTVGFLVGSVSISTINVPIDQLSANASLYVQAKDITATTGIDFYVTGTSGGIVYSGTLDAFDFTLGGLTVTVASGVTLSNDGILIPTATITLPASLGEASGTIYDLSLTSSGLSIGGGNFTLPDIKYGDGSKLKIVSPVATLALVNDQYQFSANGTLSITLPNNSINSSLAFTITQGGQLTGTLSNLNLTVAGATLTLTNVAITNSGLSVDSASLQMPASLGNTLATIGGLTIDQSGLSITDGSLILPDIKYGDGSKLKITNPSATLSVVNNQYQFSANGTLSITLPNNSINSSLAFTITQNGQLTGTLSNLNLTVAGATLTLTNIAITNSGLNVDSASLQMPTSLGNTLATIGGLTIDQSGLSITNGSLILPDIKYGDGSKLKIVSPVATLASVNNQYQFSANGTLSITLPNNSIDSSLAFTITQGGQLTGTLDNLNLTVAGATLTLTNVAITNSGLSVDSASLQMPASLGNTLATIGGLTIDQSGLSINNGSLILPDIKYGDGSKLKIVSPIVTLASVDDEYQFSANGTLSITLPNNSINSSLAFTITQGGQLTGTLDNLNLTVAGATLTLTNVAITNSGLSVDSAVLKMPASLGSAEVTINGVTIDQSGLSFSDGNLTLADIKIGDGSKVKIVNPTATLSNTGSSYLFGISGTLQLRLPGNSQDIAIVGSINSSGQFSATISSIALTLGGVSLNLNNISMDNTGLSVVTGTLVMPAKLGGVSAIVNDIRIDANGLSIANGAATFPIPNFKIGSTSGFGVSNAQAGLTIINIGGTYTYSLNLSGTVAITLPGTSALANGIVSIDNAGNMSGTINGFTLTIASLVLNVSNVTVSADGTFRVGAATLHLPANFGGGSGSVTNVVITPGQPGNLSIGGGSFALPYIKFGDGSKLKIVNAIAQLANVNNKYSLGVNATLSATLPGNSINSTFGFTITENGQLTGTLNTISLSLAGGTLTMTNVAVNNSGLSVGTASLKLPSSLGGGLATVNNVTINQSGLSVSAGSFVLADINIGDGSKVKLAAPTATLSNTTSGYMFGVSGTLQLRLPDNSQDIALSGSVNTSGQFTATISSITLSLTKASLVLSNIVMNNNGLAVATGTLVMPANLGGVSGSVNNVTIDATGLHIGGGAATFPIPNFKIGGASGFSVSNAQAGLILINSGSSYRLNLSGTIAITLPGTSALVNGLISVDNAGNISGTVNAFTLVVAGFNLNVSNVIINADGSFSIGSATLVLPGGFGGGSASVTNVVVQPGQPGSLSIGGAGITLPDIKWGDGSKVKITNASAQLTQLNNKYSFTFGGTLNLNLPGNSINSALAFSIRDDGQITGTVSLIKLTLAGSTLTLTNVAVSNSGLTVASAVLKMPASLGGTAATLNGVSIDQSGLHLNAGTLTLPDINIGDGSKVKIAAPTATLSDTASGYVFGVRGTLQLRLPSNSQNIVIAGNINSAGQFTATVSALALTFGGATLNLSNIALSNTGLSVVSGTLNLPAKLGGASGSVNNIVIDSTGLHIGGGAVTFPIPNFKIGGASGFSVSNAQAGLELTNGGLAYRLNLSGTVAINIPGSNASASGKVSVDDAGNISGQMDAFTLSVAGLGLNVSNVSINPDGSISAGSAGFTTPSGFGGASASVYNVVIRPGNPGSMSIGGGKFTLPTIKAGGFALALSGSLTPISGGYEISTTGFATFPGIGGAAGCQGIGVGATIWTN